MKFSQLYILTLCIIPILSFSQEQEYVVIGNQKWSNKNLSVATFQNGEIIREAKNKEDWLKAGYRAEPTWCYYKFDKKHDSLGKLYNYYALTSPQNIAPKGWRTPTFFDYFDLIKFLDPLITMDYFSNNGSLAGGSLKIKDKEYWPEDDCEQIDSKFNALSSGGYSPSLNHPEYDWDKSGECSRFWCVTDWEMILDALRIKDEQKRIDMMMEVTEEESAVVIRLRRGCRIDADDDPKLNGYSIRLIKKE